MKSGVAWDGKRWINVKTPNPEIEELEARIKAMEEKFAKMPTSLWEGE